MGCDGITAPPVEVNDHGAIVPLDQSRVLTPVSGLNGYWFEVAQSPTPVDTALQLEPLISGLLLRERDSLKLAKALASRYEEIELIYTISETLGTTIHLDEAAQKIVAAVSQVVGAQRASILVFDHETNQLHAVAGVGRDVGLFDPIPVDDRCSIAAQVFREQRIISYDPRDADAKNPGCGDGRNYRGTAFLSVPISYPQPDGSQRPVGVRLAHRQPDSRGDRERAPRGAGRGTAAPETRDHAGA
ncbi:MAG: hypothetical protein AMS21_11555 [Gemmatimonas sp. SG8_38_2]|nr:MAG: hypothetical protein AMS21_11555 [Gemmatimonas sp. SG8_38_2]